jgi:hypothetical protein
LVAVGRGPAVLLVVEKLAEELGVLETENIMLPEAMVDDINDIVSVEAIVERIVGATVAKMMWGARAPKAIMAASDKSFAPEFTTSISLLSLH